MANSNILEGDWGALSPRQRKAAYLLSQGYTYQEVVAEVGTNFRALAKWRDTPEFQAVLRALRAAYMDEALNQLNSQMTGVLGSLHDIAINGEKESSRINAGKVLLANWVSIRESVDRDFVQRLAERVAAIEGEAAKSAGELDYDEKEVIESLAGLSDEDLRLLNGEV